MQNSDNNINWKLYTAISLIMIAGVTLAAALTRLWVITAIPIGFLFGFFLQKGDLCGSSACSEVLVMRDWRKLFGLWVVIVTAMAGIAALDLLNLVELNPKPLIYLNYIIGGVIFGVGTVLAGGCVSGALYKAGTGNLNSIAALTGIPVGVMMVEFGPLNFFQKWMKQHIVKMNDGGAVSLPSVLGLPFWLLAVAFGIITVVAVFIYRSRRKPVHNNLVAADIPFWERVLTRPWKVWASAVAIGLLMIPAYLSSDASDRNYPLGVTHGVMQAELLIIDHDFNHIWKAKTADPVPSEIKQETTSNVQQRAVKPKGKKVVWWLIGLVISLVCGSWVSARMSGKARLLPKPPGEILIAIIGGFLVGIGAAIGGGCVVGNIMSGWALMSVGTFIFGIVTVLANWVTTYFYLMGGQTGK